MENIKEILLQIHKSQKKLRVKITVFLKKLEEVLFKKREKLDGSAIRLLLIGGEKDLFGLLQICGIRSKFKGSLKNSSYYCIKLLYRLFTEHSQKKDILQIFYDFDEDEFLTMRLASHIMSDKKNDDAGYNVARLIREKRPHLNLKSYIQDRVAQDKFEEWMKQYKSSQAQRQINQVEWKDQEGEDAEQLKKEAPKISDDFRSSNARKRDEKRMKKQKYFQEIHLKNFQLNAEYFKMTFQDPLISALEDEDDIKKSQSSKNSKRQTSMIKNQLKQVFSKRITKPEDIIKIISLNVDSGKVPTLDEVILKIHIESPDFDPIAFLSLFHTKTPNDQLEKAARLLQKEQNKGLTLNKSLVYYYLDQFLEVHRGVIRTHQNFIQVEAQSHGSYFNQLKVSQTNLEKSVDVVNQEMIKMKSDSSSLRLTLSFLNKNELLISMPSQLKKHYNKNDFEKISKLFQQAFPYLKRYKGMKIFQQVFLEIDRILQMSQDLVISQVEKNLDNRRKTTEFTNILLDLQYDYQGDSNLMQQKSNIIMGKPSNVMNNDADKRGSVMVEPEENHNLIKMIKYLEKRLSENIKINTDMSSQEENKEEKPKIQSSTYIVEETGVANTNDQENRMKKLKLINNVLFDSDRLVSFMYQSSISASTRQLKIKDIENYFTENMSRFENFYLLLQSYQDGEYDYKLPIRQGKATTRKALKHFQIIFESLKKAAQRCIQFLELNYNFRQKVNEQRPISDYNEDELNLLVSQIQRGKEDVISCSNIVHLLKQLDQKVRMGKEFIQQLQEKTLQMAYMVQLYELKVIKMERYDFYGNLTISKTFTNDDEFISPFSTYLYECLLEGVDFLTQLKIFQPQVDLQSLDKNYLKQAISICFRAVFYHVMKEHKRLQEEESEFSKATGNYSYLAFSSDLVFLILLSNIISFQKYQCKLLLTQIYDQILKKQIKPNQSASESAQNIEKNISKQVKEINSLMDQMVEDLKKKLTYLKAQEILRDSSDLFTSWNNAESQSGENQIRMSSLSPTGTTANDFKFDANTVYNISILQQLAPPNIAQSQQDIQMSQNISLDKYEIRYKMLDILSEFDQFIQLISLNCSQTLVKALPTLLLQEILMGIKDILENKQKNTNVLMLKQLRIELEFLQDATSQRIKSADTTQLFLSIYSSIDKIFQTKFSQSQSNQQLYKIDKGKLIDIIRITKYKAKLNFTFS
ncbi:hypothetical protein TTHERM_00592660 (macronuclear) [Tetrahymena thermophila SB210]|uniref:Exocyst complex component EXOC2/Sec5 N-terminal domain-containing protein n=1 Tax=Tetrahymena thermophila (strain SB210) TaxID=312017 RepID=Q232N2_TETTS|nr:hypothetical protein TTHERM_00592660 [Tetrahymena thermophila SB210]EAR91380.2 hypothetical protein TTHERM_00592660 [Tetrahymena thermophila SB210]|eukprot:XP_001011625.2 hypothetical protein TTHERM_00592660 [Tetrahymena thermophila SB210]